MYGKVISFCFLLRWMPVSVVMDLPYPSAEYFLLSPFQRH